jgi:hypothetical protein
MSFIRYNADDSVISAETITRGMWGNDGNNLVIFHTSSVITSPYYLNVYNSAATSSLQFTIQYGHVAGSGSSDINTSVADITPTRVVYGQYRSLIYNDENSPFVFGNTISPDFYAINIARSRFKESIKPGSLTLELTGSTGGLSVLHLTDDSIISGSVVNFIGSNRYYTLISGSAGIIANSQAQGVSGSYGLMFPDLGIILLNPRALSVTGSAGGIGLSVNTANGGAGVLTTPNLSTLFRAISGSNASLFILQSQETVSSRYFFTRIKNSDFNYTTNPSVINSSGSLLYDTLIDNPQTYITTVGMYNDNNELLAVAKLSRPLIKDFTKESLIRIKLDY